MVIAFGGAAAVLINPQADLVRFARRARLAAAGSKSKSKLSDGG